MLKDLDEKGEKNDIDLDSVVFIDTLPLSKRLFPNRTYYNQPSLARTFNVLIENAHRAMGDVLVLEQIYHHLMNELKSAFSADAVMIEGYKEPIKVRDYIDMKL
jgi:DNA polymerase III alpha subunit (gram-positive type)